MTTRADRIDALDRDRPRTPLVTWSLRLFALVILVSWASIDWGLSGWFGERRLANLERFVSELKPWPLRQPDTAGGIGAAIDWAADIWRARGADAWLATLAISVLAIALAGLAGAAASLPAARTVAAPEPFAPAGRRPTRRLTLLWRAVVQATRLGLIVLRAVPEYVWAFLLLALLGPTAWPMVIALALHNAGILGKLGAEVLENTDPRAPAALRAAGARRAQIVLAALVPLSLPRFLLYLFYRWETCVREATVLGMLGMASLGFWITDARARNRYDEMLLFILGGAALVLLGEIVSAIVRRAVRES